MNSELDQSGQSGPPGPDAFKTARELFTETLEGEYEDDRAWAAVRELRKQNTLQVFQVATEFCQSTHPLQRARGLDVLAQLGAGRPLSERPYFEECVRIAIQHLVDEVPLVVHSAAWALAHLADDTAISALIEIRTSADSGVRQAVAVGLAGSERPDAIQTLMDLMDDPVDEVRNWATFGLGAQSTTDSPELRQALQNRLSDTFEEARSEAIWGLACRRDPIGLGLLLERLESDALVQGDEYAAADILGLPYSADTRVPDLCSGLRQILEAMKDH